MEENLECIRKISVIPVEYELIKKHYILAQGDAFERAVMQGVPLLYGSTGEILTEKSGNLNLGIPGIMYMGGIGGVIGVNSKIGR